MDDLDIIRVINARLKALKRVRELIAEYENDTQFKFLRELKELEAILDTEKGANNG